MQTVPLGFQWPTIDPFLFCVHHDDAYPPGDGRFGPAADLAGRSIGNDFSGRDGWSMYHGRSVPGFPQHPHRGFETVTYVLDGEIAHHDSHGGGGVIREGDTQWMTAGSGVLHKEGPSEAAQRSGGRVHGLQLWVNLPSKKKMIPPAYQNIEAEHVKIVASADAGAIIRIIAGEITVDPDLLHPGVTNTAGVGCSTERIVLDARPA